jgi:hypothetical protein
LLSQDPRANKAVRSREACLSEGTKSAPSRATQTQNKAALVTASLGDAAGIKEALEGATSLFAMTTPSGGTDAEIRQGIVAADVVKAAGVHSRLHVRRLR